MSHAGWAIAALLLPTLLAGQEAVAVRAAGIEVDGRLTEAAWAEAAPAGGFVQRRPVEGAPASERTELRFLYTDDALYVGARMYSARPAGIQAPLSQRDQGEQAEHLLVSLDPYLNRRTAYTFGVTAAGTRLDWYHPADDEEERDPSFDPVWQARVARDSLGWTAEMRIPFSQLRFSPARAQRWGINARRWTPTRNEESYWVMVPREETGWASRFGLLTGVAGIRRTRRLELLPYLSTGATYTGEPGAGNPFDDGSSYTARVGADLKMGLGPNLTLEGTVNPDFGQVEADPAVVNLSAFEVFFDERRPFFLEGRDLLEGNGPGYFYSRRIGAAPRGPARGDFVDVPSTTTILGAGKLTGRLPGGTSLGAMAAVTDEEHARTWDSAGPGFGRVRVAPLAGYAILRAEQEVGASGSTVGASATFVRRDLPAGEPLAGILNREAYAGGADWNLRFRDGAYLLRGFVGASRVVGDSLAILRAQRSAARYYQRPDAGHTELDPSRTSLTGYTAQLGLARRAGSWLWEVSGSTRSPGFEINDAGSMSEADYLSSYANLRYRRTRPLGAFRDFVVGVTSENSWNHAGTRTFSALRSDATVTWSSFLRSEHTAWIDLRGQSDRATRGGPLMGTGWSWVTINRLSSSAAARNPWWARLYYGESEFGGRTYRVSGSVSTRPRPRWQLSAGPNFVHYADPRQYVATLGDGPAATYGSRYVFAFLDRREFSVPARLSYLFTPDLSLEVYLEPFIASGDYHDHGELPAARSRELRPYPSVTPDADGSLLVRDGAAELRLPDRDFNIRSLRSNAVLRWEWRPGSTVHLVWQQNRYREQTLGGRISPLDVWDTFATTGDNVLVLKVSYWVGVG